QIIFYAQSINTHLHHYQRGQRISHGCSSVSARARSTRALDGCKTKVTIWQNQQLGAPGT
ncbi:MAG TPA: hypothetical protein VFM05_03040, partial [Candidatus Saccharimonadales bacterium]|nr:hypothetical protein [Candidatus Saccharimonadales bacterium]